MKDFFVVTSRGVNMKAFYGGISLILMLTIGVMGMSMGLHRLLAPKGNRTMNSWEYEKAEKEMKVEWINRKIREAGMSSAYRARVDPDLGRVFICEVGMYDTLYNIADWELLIKFLDCGILDK